MQDEQDKREAERASWQYRCIERTGGPVSLLGAMVLAVLSKQRSTLPQLGYSASITNAGFVVSDFIAKDAKFYPKRVVCHVDDLVANFSGLADHLKLSDADRVELFKKVRAWIFEDHRKDPNLHFTVQQLLGRE